MPFKARIQGEHRRVVAACIITKEGKITGAELQNVYSDKKGKKKLSKFSKADKEIIYESLISMMNFRFEPAEQKGKRVKVTMTIPIDFGFKN